MLAAAAAAVCGGAWAETFSTEYFTGSFDSTLSLGTGIRTKAPSASLIVEGNQGGPAGQLAVT
ncbi:MAG: DUF1302 family protein, partial [Rhodobacteraceae bacterium]|nr:DUF1302 family protein [Paracoccaceae bacterium]